MEKFENSCKRKKLDVQCSEESNHSLKKARQKLEKQYFNNLSSGLRVRKNSAQIETLLQHFDRK